MKVLFIAGFGPITSNVTESRRLYEDALGIRFKVEDGEYLHTEGVKGVNTFAVWPLTQAAESCFGNGEWPADTAVPHAWLEFDVDDIEAATRGGVFLVGQVRGRSGEGLTLWCKAVCSSSRARSSSSSSSWARLPWSL